MDREPVPSAIVARLLEAAKELETWAVEHRQASLAEHERGVLRIFDASWGRCSAECWNGRSGWTTRPLSGKAVVCEKPLAASYLDGLRAVEAVTSRGRPTRRWVQLPQAAA